ncbi:MogA/MoaB family molybdenum cofactor biosynthesis protein [Halobacillus salinarum]|uniref:Molybdenum cofactor biosynthesis protein B n=1 Tax=Halobacillus salinarum TaxID=2932257 RepID=A0ABY4ENW2_9BACI|nr:MogA/MoaB family molybdenum cofactor biosynthesis protein [Halobacillus salinarum]UOQ46149.1 MogA/MoaB family molybdenum cofactor biosynthesis protein [Halobacillus salinarum]
MTIHNHRRQAVQSVKCKIITISDTRTKENDKSGRMMKEYLEGAVHEVLNYTIIKDEQSAIEEAVKEGINNPEIEAILTNGGTGIAPRDVTIEVVESLYDKHIPGFGELFRMLSYTEDIGSASLLSRASAGIVGKTAVFSTPGSSGAVKLAMTQLILPELGHVTAEMKKKE